MLPFLYLLSAPYASNDLRSGGKKENFSCGGVFARNINNYMNTIWICWGMIIARACTLTCLNYFCFYCLFIYLVMSLSTNSQFCHRYIKVISSLYFHLQAELGASSVRGGDHVHPECGRSSCAFHPCYWVLSHQHQSSGMLLLCLSLPLLLERTLVRERGREI